MSFECSTQFTHWLFTQEQLSSARRDRTAAAGDAPHDSKRVKVVDDGTGGSDADVRAAEVKLLETMKAMRVPPEVTATSVTLFKRFYVHNHPAVFPPDTMLPAAGFVGIKAEACPWREVGPFTQCFQDKLRLPNNDPMVDNEMSFLLGVQFHLAVHHPFVALNGFLRRMEPKIIAVAPSGLPPPPPAAGGGDADAADDDADVDSDPEGGPRSSTPEPPTKSGHVLIGELHKRAHAVILWGGLLTDAPLLFTPGQLALASLSVAVGELSGRAGDFPPMQAPIPDIVAQFVASVVTPPPGSTTDGGEVPSADTLRTLLARAQAMLLAGLAVTA